MKKKFLLSVACIIAFSLIGCKKVEKTEVTIIEANVDKLDYSPSWVQPISCGEITTNIIYPEEYNVKLSYEGEKYTLDNERIYKYCKNKINKKVKCVLKTTTFDDESNKKHIEKVLTE